MDKLIVSAAEFVTNSEQSREIHPPGLDRYSKEPHLSDHSQGAPDMTKMRVRIS